MAMFRNDDIYRLHNGTLSPDTEEAACSLWCPYGSGSRVCQQQTTLVEICFSGGIQPLAEDLQKWGPKRRYKELHTWKKLTFSHWHGHKLRYSEWRYPPLSECFRHIQIHWWNPSWFHGTKIVATRHPIQMQDHLRQETGLWNLGVLETWRWQVWQLRKWRCFFPSYVDFISMMGKVWFSSGGFRFTVGLVSAFPIIFKAMRFEPLQRTMFSKFI